MLLMARNGGVRCPSVEVLTTLDDGSVALAMEDVPGTPLDSSHADEIDDALLDAVWREASALHRARIAHRALAPFQHPRGRGRADDHRHGLRQGVGVATAASHRSSRAAHFARGDRRRRARRRVGRARARILRPRERLAVPPTARARRPRTRKPATKALLQELRTDIAAVTGEEPPPLERLIRVNPRTLLMIAVSVGAFYFLLPQLADVGDSFTALRSANFWWLAVCVVMSLLTYVASAIGQQGGVPGPPAVRRRTSARRPRPRSSIASRRPTSVAWRSTSGSCRRPASSPRRR